MLHGALVPNLTFFREDGSLDLETTRRHMLWLLRCGADGLFLTGTYGSGPMMTLDERAQLFRLAKELVADFPGRSLLAHVGCIDTQSTVELAQVAAQIGVNAVSAIPSFYYKNSEADVLEFYRALVRAVDLPVFAYNNPEVARFAFTLNTVRKLQEMGLAGIKDSQMDIGFVSTLYYENKAAGRDFQLIVGSSKGWLPFYQMGIRAMIAGQSNWAPEIITRLVAATTSGDWPLAERIYLVMMELSRRVQVAESIIASHMALQARGFVAGHPRRPLALPPSGDPRYATVRDALRWACVELGIELQIRVE